MGAIAQMKQVKKQEGVQTKWVVVTPHQATKWLEGNVHNRAVRDAVVQRYATDMKAGRWKQTHQGIAFDEDGTLIDGQHRLFAVIEAEVDVLMQVTTGLSSDTQLVVDDGLKRTVLDVMKVNGRAMDGLSALHVAVSEMMFRGLVSGSSIGPRPRQEQQMFLQKHWEAIDFATSILLSKRVRGVSTASVGAVIARAYYHEDREQLKRFATVLVEGLSVDERDRAAMRLRDWLVTKPGGSGAAHGQAIFAKVMRAMRDHFAGKTLSRNLVPATTDLYPIKFAK